MSFRINFSLILIILLVTQGFKAQQPQNITVPCVRSYWWQVYSIESIISILYNAGALNAKYLIFTEIESVIISLLHDVEFNLNCVFQLHLYRNEVAKYLQMHGEKTTKDDDCRNLSFAYSKLIITNQCLTIWSRSLYFCRSIFAFNKTLPTASIHCIVL